MPPPSFQSLPCDHAEMDEHHLLAFKESNPWWIRPTLRETPYKITDFVADIRGNIETAMSNVDPKMGCIFKVRRIFAQSFGYRAARDSASRAKTGYGADNYVDFMDGTVGMIKRAKRFGIPEGDPLYGKYGIASREHVSGKGIGLVDLTTDEKKLVEWLHQKPNIDAIFQSQELTNYMSRHPSSRVILYMVDLRKKIADIVTSVAGTADELDPQWRTECVDLCIDDMARIVGDKQQQEVDMLLDGQSSQDCFYGDPDEVIKKYIQPYKGFPEKQKLTLSLLEQLFVVKAHDRDISAIQKYVTEWNAITKKMDIAPNERPTGGLATLTLKCAFDNTEQVKAWLGPNDSKNVIIV